MIRARVRCNGTARLRVLSTLNQQQYLPNDMTATRKGASPPILFISQQLEALPCLLAGRGRWANHVKRGGGRGARPSQPSPSPQGTPRPAKTGRGRRGGRWGGRGGGAGGHSLPRLPDPERAAGGGGGVWLDVRFSAFEGIVDALQHKADGLPFAGFHASPSMVSAT